MRCAYVEQDQLTRAVAHFTDATGRCRSEALESGELCTRHYQEAHRYDGWYADLLETAVSDIRDMLIDDEDPLPSPETLVEMGKRAVRYYADDDIRAERWSHALGGAVEHHQDKTLEAEA